MRNLSPLVTNGLLYSPSLIIKAKTGHCEKMPHCNKSSDCLTEMVFQILHATVCFKNAQHCNFRPYQPPDKLCDYADLGAADGRRDSADRLESPSDLPSDMVYPSGRLRQTMPA
ncbi:hypothetical protein DPEC_G00334760 [Dallia pectoralis]|uniref:Uncharacterized protein n=1 Tax=Dallia pectoralis TaxID=75939 RepID=A0ACC2F6R9_DALPE|nr:hypothetical protein DPEC_G00334760 [Dallia pectoralis]